MENDVSWQAFEEDVREILSLQGWEVHPEKLIGHKKVDSYAEKMIEFGRRRRIAVECKRLSKPMAKTMVAEVAADYLPLLQTAEIDYVLLVTLKGLAPSAETYTNDTEWLVHITHADLLRQAIDFSRYLNGLVAQCTRTSLDRVYIDQACQAADGSVESDLLGLLLRWIEEEDSSPIAVLGGYGMGKSTLAKRLALELANMHASDSQSRIPILLRLEDISTHQRLDGLLGRQFTSDTVVSNYNFHIFLRLNEIGRFVIILDGFDEMKRTMTWESLRYNFSQLNGLVANQSKVVLLGRPSAFLSEGEYNEALHGRRKVLDSERMIPGWPDYREFHLLPFDRAQIEEYIEKYILLVRDDGYKTSVTQGPRAFLDALYQRKEKGLLDLASRPVQLKMLVEILPSYEGDVDDLTVSVLYSEFIDLVIRRELEKEARRSYSVKERHSFAVDLAYWMWKTGSGTQTVVSRIPESIFQPYSREGIDSDAVRRDLLSGCFLEAKPPEGLYFPHRSFLEFLVAEGLLEMVRKRDTSVLSCPVIPPEIAQFFPISQAKRTLAPSGVGWLKLGRTRKSPGNVSGWWPPPVAPTASASSKVT